MRRYNTLPGQTTAPLTIRVIAARRGMLHKTQALSLGTAKLLRRTRTPTRFALAHCITSALMRISRRELPAPPSAFSRQVRLSRLDSRRLAEPAARRRPRPQAVLRQRQLQQL